MSLVATRLLTLTALSHIVGQGTIIVAVQKIVRSTLILSLVVAIHTDSHSQFARRRTPVAVGIRRLTVELIEHRQECLAKHPFRQLRVLLRPSRPLGVAHQLAGIYEDESLQGSAEWSIVTVDANESLAIRTDNLHRLLRMSLVTVNDEEQRIVVCSKEIVLAWPLGLGMLTIASDYVVRSSHLIVCACLRVRHEFLVRAHRHSVLLRTKASHSLDGFLRMQQAWVVECHRKAER